MPMEKFLELLGESYKKFTNKKLIDIENSNSIIAAHSNIPNLIDKLDINDSKINECFDITADPIFIYGNQAALNLWELSFEEFVCFPSRNTADADQQNLRNALLQEVLDKGFIENYSGIRVSKSGKKFIIENATVFQVYDLNGRNIAQAVVFTNWKYI